MGYNPVWGFPRTTVYRTWSSRSQARETACAVGHLKAVNQPWQTILTLGTFDSWLLMPFSVKFMENMVKVLSQVMGLGAL